MTSVASGAEAEAAPPDSAQEEKRLGLLAQLFRFVLIGGFCACIDLGTNAILWSLGVVGVPGSDIARAIGFILGTTTAYFLNRKFTFAAGAVGGSKQIGAFMLVYGTTFFVAVGVNRLALELLPDFWLKNPAAWVISQGCQTLINFIMLKLVVFREKKPEQA